MKKKGNVLGILWAEAHALPLSCLAKKPVGHKMGYEGMFGPFWFEGTFGPFERIFSPFSAYFASSPYQ